MGEWRYSSTILDLDAVWRRIATFMPQPLYLKGNSAQYSFGRRMGVSQCLSGNYGEKILPLPGIETRLFTP
jgi:hypothetical protein